MSKPSFTQPIRSDIERLSGGGGRGPSTANADAEIIAAFSRMARLFLDAGAEGLASVSPADPADGGILDRSIAQTPMGVALKLRYALFCKVDTIGTIAAAFGASVPDIDEMMEMEGTDALTIWTAIKSLEAIEARP